MTATKAVVTIHGHRVEVSETTINALNAALADCPAASSTYGDSKPDASKRLVLKPMLEIQATFEQRVS